MEEAGGQSAARVAGRSGFQRLGAEVSVAPVGLLCGLELSRWARSHRAWHHRLAGWAVCGTRLGDLEGLYAPSAANDRLWWGLKGAMSAAALQGRPQRLRAGQRAQAARGALGMPVPLGSGRRPAGAGAQEPEAQAQAGMARSLAQWARVGPIHAGGRSRVPHPSRVPQRVRCGPKARGYGAGPSARR